MVDSRQARGIPLSHRPTLCHGVSSNYRSFRWWRKLLKPIVEKYDGSWLKEMGDGLLLSFDSATSAVECAIKIQEVTRDIEALDLRIGIHQGEIIEHEGDVFGDDVNIASRIEPFAAVGGIAISDMIQRDISSNPFFTTKYVGRPRLKGVQQEVKVYCIISHGLPETKLSEVSAKLEKERSLWGKWAIPTMVAIAAVTYFIIPKEHEVPSVAILRMENLGSQEDEFWARGITEDLIISIASAGMIQVTPMQEIMKVAGSEWPLRELGEKLRVKYLLASSIYKHDDVIDLRTQLIEGSTGMSIYARKWSEPLESASTITSTLAKDILQNLGVSSEPRESRQVQVDPEAYEFYLRGKYRWQKRQNQEDVEIARGYLVKAFELDQNLLAAKLHLGQSYQETGDYERAIKIFHECLEQSGKVGDKISEAVALRNMGNIYLSTGYYDEAIEYYEQSLLISRYLGDKLNEQSALRNMGSAYYSKDAIEPALKYYQRSLEMSLELGHRRGEGDALHNLGSVNEEIGEYERALDSYSQALRIFRELGEKSPESYSRIGMGNIYTRKGMHQEALVYLEESLKLAREISDKRSEVYALINAGGVYYQINQDERALEYYQEALGIAQSIGDKYNEGVSWTRLGELMLQKGEYAESMQFFESACNVWEELNYLSHYVWALSWWALSELKSGSVEATSNKADQVETIIAKTEPYETYVIAVNWNLSQIYAGLRMPVKANTYLQKAYEEVMRRAKRFKDSTERGAFLTKIRENRAIISAYGQIAEPGS